MNIAGAKTTTDVSPDASFPDLPTAALESGGWKRVEKSVETVSRVPTVRVIAATVRYEDERTRAALRRATTGEVDHPVRFFAATTLSFRPSLPLGVSKAMAAPVVRREACERFAKRLREVGLADVTRTDRERLTFDGGTRITLTQYEATASFAPNRTVPLRCWVGIWAASSGFRIVSGGYPRESLASVFGLEGEQLERTPQAYYLEFLSLLRAVE